MSEKRKMEILSPAASPEVMKACFAAGADAVYMGLSKFSARAYTDNADLSAYLQAIDYAHLYGKKLYLTLNILMKENEISSELFSLLNPLYQRGLDAVIVQDAGLMVWLSEHFPKLPIHISTQATMTGPFGIQKLKVLKNITRVVPARELSLREIKKIKDETGLEVETFIHGALCYGYSGQCLFSSIVGGRSGNRGRCAQPCRMAYRIFDENGNKLNDKDSEYVLSLKDLNTIRLLPKLYEAGIDSLKIEGRMKKAEYAAGVTSIYRKYVDRILSPDFSEENYFVSREDEKHLFDLFNREGFSEGYYETDNGASMLTLKEPSFREHDDSFIHSLTDRFIENRPKIKLSGSYEARLGTPLNIKISMTDSSGNVFEKNYEDKNLLPEAAESRATTSKDLEEKLNRTGDTLFEWTSLTGTVQDGIFLPISKVNQFRRDALKFFEESYLKQFQRETGTEFPALSMTKKKSKEKLCLSALVTTKEQLSASLNSRVEKIILSSDYFEFRDLKNMVAQIHEKGKAAYFAFPEVIRDNISDGFESHVSELKSAGFDGFLVRSLESLGFLENNAIHGKKEADHNLYTWNSYSKNLYASMGFSEFTAPVELHKKEILERDQWDEIIVYGHLPMMISKNCIRKTLKGCNGKNEMEIMEDRMNNRMTVQSICRFCYNRILNAVPLNLITEADTFRKAGFHDLRLQLITETEEETEKILRQFEAAVLENKPPVRTGNFTNGHFRRGVE